MNIYDFKVQTIEGEEISLSKYKGKALLIVNVASECGLTYQYEGLEKLYQKYKKKGFMILAFPSNQFSNQEPGTNKEIKFFCKSKYDVHFDMFSKIEVNGEGADPLYKFLKKEKGGFLGFDAIKWNFTKFLVDKNGKVIQRYSPSTNPSKIQGDIEKLL
ncbi:MAG: glutathione peroxidase [Helicobacteraceae bacterium]|nr:glutathione peroxidase [Candidatus Sulfurimonas ponti]MBL6972794.1 glutathione peroxidase [Sulfurimonas sp.]